MSLSESVFNRGWIGPWKFQNQPNFRKKLPSMHRQTRISSLCEPSTQTPALLKKKKKNLALYHFFLANLRRQTLKYDLKPPDKRGWQPLESSRHSLRSPPGDALRSLSCHSGFADASAPVRYKTGITAFSELNKLFKTRSSSPSHFLILLETHRTINLFSGTVPR